ncbi:SpoIIE family protein phosphatase [Micromonospora sp. CA-111912]|uniref:PP2C family protein-serine/threonine phosphatase n=1 Tax=Micromonospora sp. CA-111912 TaxID=3239955 RepID=UPI003D8C9E0E
MHADHAGRTADPVDPTRKARLASRLGGTVAARWFEALYETPLLFAAILDDAGRVLDANQPVVEGCGLERAEVLGRPFWACGWWTPDPELSARLRGWCEAVLRTGEPLRTRSHFFLGDGTRRLVDLVLFRVGDDDGAGYLMVTGLDVTDALATQREREHRVDVQADALHQVAEARQRAIETVRRAEWRAEERLRRLVVVALELLGAETVADLTTIVVDHAVPVLGADGGALVVRQGTDRLRVVVGERLGRQVQAGGDLPYDSPLPAGHTARTGELLLLPDRAAGLAFTPQMAEVYRITERDAWAFLPLRVGTGLLGALAVSWRDEREFAPDEIAVLEAFAAQTAQALDRIQHLRARRESALAAQRLSEALQYSLLTQPPTAALLDIAVRYQPAAHEAKVGGDWYDAFETADGATMLVVGDVTGHDREAVAAMGQIRNLLRGLGYDSGDGPAALLGRLDRALRGLRVGALATAVLGRVERDPEDPPGMRRLRWSNAGHPPPLLRGPDGSVRVLAAHDLLLGVDPDANRRELVVELAEGSTLVLYTDGLVERRDGVLDDGIEVLARRLAEIGDRPAEEVCDLLLRVAPPGHEDDIALLVMGLRPTAPVRAAAGRRPGRGR